MRKIPKVRAGSGRTMLSASLANQVIEVCNMILAMRPGPGLKVSLADTNIVIELSDELQRGLALKGDGEGGDGVAGGQGPGALRWRGEWSSAEQYQRNDLVIHRTDAALVSGNKAGTYIALVDNEDEEPEEKPFADQDTWATFSKGAWDYLKIGDPDTDAGNVVLDQAQCFGRTIRLREIDVCDSGVARKMIILASEIYDA